MIHKYYLHHVPFTFMVSSRQAGFQDCCGIWRIVRNALEWNNPIPRRCALPGNLKNRTLHLPGYRI